MWCLLGEKKLGVTMDNLNEVGFDIRVSPKKGTVYDTIRRFEVRPELRGICVHSITTKNRLIEQVGPSGDSEGPTCIVYKWINRYSRQ